MNKYKVIDETNKAIRVFYKKAEAIRFLQDGWTIQLVKVPNRYKQALANVGECLL